MFWPQFLRILVLHWMKEHVTIVLFMKTHCYKIQMELQLREKPMLSMTKAHLLSDCTPRQNLRIREVEGRL